MRIYLTGRIAAEHDGHVVIDERELPGRQGRMIFAYLVSQRDRPVTRDRLMDVLWGDDRPPEGDGTLSAVLSRLRSLLKKTRTADVGIDADRSGVSLRLPSGTWVDLEAAANAVDLCEGAARRADWAAAWGHANVSIVIASRPFLAGDEAPWIESWRRRLAAIRVRALQTLMATSVANGELALAIQHAEEILAIEPYLETAYQDLMRLHARMGNRAEALRVFTRCRERLKEDLGTRPSPQTEQAWRSIDQDCVS